MFAVVGQQVITAALAGMQIIVPAGVVQSAPALVDVGVGHIQAFAGAEFFLGTDVLAAERGAAINTLANAVGSELEETASAF